MSKRLANFCIGALTIAVIVLQDMEATRFRRLLALTGGCNHPYGFPMSYPLNIVSRPECPLCGSHP